MRLPSIAIQALRSGAIWSLLATGALASEAPRYIAEMSPFQVRNMSGTWAPENGLATIESVTPSEWRTNDPGLTDLRGVVVAWSGGAKGEGTRLIVHGGGHNDSANNGVYQFDFSGSDRPRGWIIAGQSPVAAVRESASYADGAAAASHTYDGVVQVNNRMYRFGGARWSERGGFFADAFVFDLAANRWSRLPDVPSDAYYEPSVAYDPVSNKILVMFSNSFANWAFFRCDTNQWGAARVPSSALGIEASSAYDSRRGRVVSVGNGVNRIITPDWSAETFSVSSFSPSGSTGILSRSALAMFYDPERDSFWIFGGATGSPGYASIYEMDAGSLSITAYPLSMSTASFEADYQGSFGRFVFLREWRAIGFVTRTDAAPYVIKLPPPDTSSTEPRPPVNLDVR